MHPIKRGVLVVLLSLGAIGGFSHGFARMAQCHESCGASRRDQFEEHIADVCTRSAERALEQRQSDQQRAAPPPQGYYGAPPAGYWGSPPPSQWGPPPSQWGPPPSWAAPPAPVAAPVAPTAPVTE